LTPNPRKTPRIEDKLQIIEGIASSKVKRGEKIVDQLPFV
jgi:hypothetical protein